MCTDGAEIEGGDLSRRSPRCYQSLCNLDRDSQAEHATTMAVLGQFRGRDSTPFKIPPTTQGDVIASPTTAIEPIGHTAIIVLA